MGTPSFVIQPVNDDETTLFQQAIITTIIIINLAQ
jgi:hypothetical protein